MDGGKEGRTCFLKKSSKKLLAVWAEPIRAGSAQFAKVFWFFFSKKNGLPFVMATVLLPPAAAPASPNLHGKLIFLRCASCHNIGPGPEKIGPNLAGVVGRKAGSLPGYSYSPAMKQASFIWTEANLDRWLTRPSDLVPGTAMAFAGLPAERDRQAVIAYLRQPGP
jgi:cytochrome c